MTFMDSNSIVSSVEGNEQDFLFCIHRRLRFKAKGTGPVVQCAGCGA